MGNLLLIFVGILVIAMVIYKLQHFQKRYLLNSVVLKQIDQMKGNEFEEYLKVLFQDWDIQRRKPSKQGITVLI